MARFTKDGMAGPFVPTVEKRHRLPTHVRAAIVKNIAAYLATNRETVHAVLQRWIAEGVAGLDNKASAPRHPARKTNLKRYSRLRSCKSIPRIASSATSRSCRRCKRIAVGDCGHSRGG